MFTSVTSPARQASRSAARRPIPPTADQIERELAARRRVIKKLEQVDDRADAGPRLRARFAARDFWEGIERFLEIRDNTAQDAEDDHDRRINNQTEEVLASRPRSNSSRFFRFGMANLTGSDNA